MPLTHITEREIIQDLNTLKIGQEAMQKTLDRIDERLEKGDEKMKANEEEMNTAKEESSEARHKASRALFQVGLLWGAVIAVVTALVAGVATGVIKLK